MTNQTCRRGHVIPEGSWCYECEGGRPLEWKDGKWYRWFVDPDEGWVKSECIPQPEPPVIK